MNTTITVQDLTRHMLLELKLPTHLWGYKILCAAIPSYARNNTQSITKELYPHLAKQFGLPHPKAAEHSIRYTISEAWNRRDPDVWDQYFPGSKKAPSNLVFIAALAEYLK